MTVSETTLRLGSRHEAPSDMQRWLDDRRQFNLATHGSFHATLDQRRHHFHHADWQSGSGCLAFARSSMT